jgi:hypothetical protein
MTTLEHERVREVKEAQTKAEGLFHEVEARRLIRPGITEGQLKPASRRGAGGPAVILLRG